MKTALRTREYRYVELSVQPAQEENILRAKLSRYFASFFGVMGMAEVRPKIVGYDSARSQMLLRCNRGSEMTLCAALSLCSQLEGKIIRLKPLRVSGTIAGIGRKAEKEKEE